MSAPNDKQAIPLKLALKKIQKFKVFLQDAKDRDHITHNLTMQEASAMCFYWQAEVERVIKEFITLNGFYSDGMEDNLLLT